MVKKFVSVSCVHACIFLVQIELTNLADDPLLSPPGMRLGLWTGVIIG